MRWAIIVLMLSIFLLAACGPTEIEDEDRVSCETVDDCVPLDCCHSDGAVNKVWAPICDDILCSAECVPNTLDCQQGHIECVEGACEVFIDEVTLEEGPQ